MFQASAREHSRYSNPESILCLPVFEETLSVSSGRPLLHDLKVVLAGRGKPVNRMCAVARAGQQEKVGYMYPTLFSCMRPQTQRLAMGGGRSSKLSIG